MRKLKLEELNRIDVVEYKRSEKSPIIVILDNIRSLNNIGSVFRTSDAFRIEKIYLCGITAKPPHREIHKTALGATESVEWQYFSNTEEAIGKLKNENVEIFAIEQMDKCISLVDFIPPAKKMAFIFGNEVKGVSDDIIPLVDECIEIPQYGTKHSLNISVCAGIVLWDVFNKLELNIE